jgi:hypothetical protein
MLTKVFEERLRNRPGTFREGDSSVYEIHISNAKESKLRKSQTKVVRESSHQESLAPQLIQKPLDVFRSDSPKAVRRGLLPTADNYRRSIPLYPLLGSDTLP